MKKLFLAIGIILILLVGCVQQPKIPDYCEEDIDCEIKDAHNCCGYYPRCFNKNYEPDIEAVIKECQDKGFMGVCGYPEITNCECVNNKCLNMQNDMVV